MNGFGTVLTVFIAGAVSFLAAGALVVLAFRIFMRLGTGRSRE